MIDISTQLVGFVRTKLDDAGHDVAVTEHQRKQGVGLPHVLILPETTGDSVETLAGDFGHDVSEIEIVSFAATGADAFTYAEVIRDSLQGYRGAIGTATVLSCTSTDPFEKGCDKPIAGGNTLIFWVARSYRLGHN